jgi:glycosyltransferase involved in cell wall biosynthesis
VTPPLYDLTPLFDATRSLEGVSLTVCCRAAEWETARAKYGVDTGADLQIVHTSGRGLDSLYAEADLFSMALGLDAYRAVTVPVKLLECLGYGVPVVAIGESETARLIAEEGVGWVVNSVEEFRALLASLRDDPSPIAAKRQRIAEVRPRHTWAARAQGVADTLTGLRVVA